MKNKNLSWFAALLVFALLLWCTAATPGKIADPSTYTCAVYSTIFSLLPPVIAIVLALNTKEVYTSLLVGIASGALLYANGNLELAINTLFFNEDGGMVAKLSDSSNVGILVFLVMLGILVALMNKAGGSAAFGRWASTHIHSRAGAQFATLLLGVMIFVDDYFNCLTVGSVMRPVTDRQKVSRAKLAYLIDATAAPVCIIAPVSSWAAAVTSSVPEGSGINGFTMFLRTIPYNYYAVLTVVMSLFLIFTGAEFGPMKLNEDNAKNGDLFTTADRPYGNDVDDGTDTCGHVADLIAPVLVLIAACIFGMIYTGGFFEGVDFVTAFADCNASAGLVLGSSIALLFTFVFYRVRNVMTFQDFAACIPEGFKAMVSPMLILSLAWTLSGMTGLLGGLACGWPYGLVCGLLGPVLSGVLTGMPSPAVLPGMMVECGVYGLVSGLMMQAVHTKKLYADLYISQITAMLLGRILSGVCKALIFAPATFTVAAWATTSFVTGLPGIAIQLVLLPSLVVALTKARLLRVRYA